MNEQKDESSSERIGLLEMIDNLIDHINTERIWFNVLCLSSIIVAPASLFFTLFILTHPRVLLFLFRIDAAIGMLAMAYLIANLVVSSLWLIIGLKEFRFLSKWNQRFKKYRSLKEHLDRELEKEFQA